MEEEEEEEERRFPAPRKNSLSFVISPLVAAACRGLRKFSYQYEQRQQSKKQKIAVVRRGVPQQPSGARRLRWPIDDLGGRRPEPSMAGVSEQTENCSIASAGFLRRSEQGRKTQRSDGSVLLDMEGLSLLADASNSAANTGPGTAAAAAAASPPTALMPETLSRKSSQHGDRTPATGGGENFQTALAVAAGGGRGVPAVTAAASPTAAAATDKFVAVALSDPAVAAPTPSPRRRRRSLAGRSAAPHPWLNPRRVLLVSATLSSMGTIILLYFTWSIGRTADGGAAVWR